MPARLPKFAIIPNPELIAAGRAFMPRFGNDGDLNIVNQAVGLQKMLGTVDNRILRGDPQFHTAKMKQILQKERWLISSITSSNMDF